MTESSAHASISSLLGEGLEELHPWVFNAAACIALAVGVEVVHVLLARISQKWQLPVHKISGYRILVFAALPILAMIVYDVWIARLQRDDVNMPGSVGRIYECPSSDRLGKALNDVGDYFDYYGEWNTEHDEMGLEGFRERFYGGRMQTYSAMKELVTDFKVKVFGEELQSGDVFYESACGEGMNALMTMEILKEELGIDNLVAYGNDYLADSTVHANALFDMMAKEHDWIKKGVFCRGDSTDLSFVPASTFDLAYTGFLDPLVDPLHRLGEEMTEKERVEKSRELCSSTDPEDIKLSQQEQSAQEAWHASWTTELIRIVKPGQLVVIEDVGHPVCDKNSEWGGVSIDWWTKAASKYKWDVDPSSIRVVERAWYRNRYNVMMRRNPLAADLS